MSDNQHLVNRKIKRWLRIIVLLAVGLFLVSLIFNKYFWDSIITSVRMKIVQKRIEQQEQKYIDDTYGGKTPEETYSMFLEALKRKDIELASRYFVLEKQKEYAKALNEIDDSGKWDLMMEDLTRLETASWEKITDDYVNLELFSKDNVSVEKITFILPNNLLPPNNPISNIWKISSF